MIPIFAELPDPTAEALFSWLKVIGMLAGLYLLAVKIVEHHTEKPPMDKQVRDVEARLNASIDAVSKWVTGLGYVSKAELKSAIDQLKEMNEERDDIAQEFRKSLKVSVDDLAAKMSERTGKIFDSIRSLGREISHMEGRLSKTTKVTLTQEGPQ